MWKELISHNIPSSFKKKTSFLELKLTLVCKSIFSKLTELGNHQQKSSFRTFPSRPVAVFPYSHPGQPRISAAYRALPFPAFYFRLWYCTDCFICRPTWQHLLLSRDIQRKSSPCPLTPQETESSQGLLITQLESGILVLEGSLHF